MLSTVIGDDCFLSHLAFGHSVKIGRECYILGHVTMYDGAEIGDNVFIEGNSTILPDAKLKSGWAYSGVVDKDTKPDCKTSQKVFGTDPETGRILYVGGEEGVSKRVNNSHLRRNNEQMRLVAFKHGCPEQQLPAHAVMIPHVYQTGIHYLSIAAQLLEKIGNEHQGKDHADLKTVYKKLAMCCCGLCACMRVIYDGEPLSDVANEAWIRRTSIIEQVVEIVSQTNTTYLISVPSLNLPVLQQQDDFEITVRKLKEFEEVMQQQEQLCAMFFGMQE